MGVRIAFIIGRIAFIIVRIDSLQSAPEAAVIFYRFRRAGTYPETYRGLNSKINHKEKEHLHCCS
jgi:hypothetical protein